MTRAEGEAKSFRSEATRELILTVAERLFAERGIFAVSNRQVSEAAQQGNNTAVNYHFGSKTDLILAISARHAAEIEERRIDLSRKVEGSTDVRDWVTCLVKPSTSHLAALGIPSWYARFNSQVLTDPHLRVLVNDDGWRASPAYRGLMVGFGHAVADLPLDLRRRRAAMARNLVVHTCAEQELLLATQDSKDIAPWDRLASDLIDAVVAIWQAPVTPKID